MGPSAGDSTSDRATRDLDGRRQGAGLRLLRALVSPDSYGLVLLLIVVSYALSVSVRQVWASSLVLFVQIVTVWFALRTSQAHRLVRLVALVVLVAAAGVAVFGIVGAPDKPPVAVFLVSSLLYVIAPVSIVRHIAFRPVVDQETMLGAIAAYLLIGMAFAFLYRAVGTLQSGLFFGSNGDGSISQDLFFSFTTLTTTGYGNLVPAGQPGQSLAVAEMILGQLFLITALGKVVTAWRPRGWTQGVATASDPREP